MATAVIFSDFESTSSAPGLVLDKFGGYVQSTQYEKEDIVKKGYLWKKGFVGRVTSSATRMSSRARYFVLNNGSLDYYRNDKCVSLPTGV